jgi:hypothetical protein
MKKQTQKNISRQPFLSPLLICSLLILTFYLVSCQMEDDLPDTNKQIEIEAPLQNTAWKWNDLTLKFIDAAQAQLSGEVLSYTYNSVTRGGAIDTVGAFTITENFETLGFVDYKGLGGRIFTNQNSAMSGTVWRYGYAALNFISLRKVKSHDEEYTYTFDNDTKTGVIDVLGNFSKTETNLTFSNYRTSSIAVVYEKRNDFNAAYENTLIGTAWGWNNSWNGWMVLEFLSPDKMILTFTGSHYFDNTPWEYDYTYSNGPKTGTIPGPRYGPVITSEGASGLGVFSINGSAMHFLEWQNFGHGADYTRIGD